MDIVLTMKKWDIANVILITLCVFTFISAITHITIILNQILQLQFLFIQAEGLLDSAIVSVARCLEFKYFFSPSFFLSYFIQQMTKDRLTDFSFLNI